MADVLHKDLLLHQIGNLVRIQPLKDGSSDGPALAIELKSHTVGLMEGSVPLSKEKGSQKIYGIIGLQKLVEGSAIAVITGAKQVAILRGHPIYKVTSSHVIASTDAHIDDERYAALLRYAVDPTGAGKGLFFSYGGDITLSQQRQTAMAKYESGSIANRADPRFFFNRQLTLGLTEWKVAGIEKFILPVIMGSVQQLPSVTFGDNTLATITLIARRSVQRAGVRHWRRGADAEGVVANFVETEQLAEVTTPSGTVVSSFVQIRGSIPLLWSQIPNIKYKPTTRLAPKSAYQSAFDRHVSDLVNSYKGIVAVNLANQHGSEGVLSSAFKDEADRYASKASGLKLVPFDFHKQCGATRYDKLSLLWSEIRADFEQFGYYVEGPGLSSRQNGVFRVNCIDCLDRTNVVQGVLARIHLEYLLRQLRLLDDSATLPNRYPKVEALFKVIWANHGDDISLQYAGTGALKSGFTRTGVRTKAGLADDGWKSGVRYYLNNFEDGHKQDALDFVSGSYVITKGKRSPFKSRPNPYLPIMAMLISILYGLRGLYITLLGKYQGSIFTALFRDIGLPFAFSAFMLMMIVKFGKKLVNRPQLRPDLSQPW